MIYNKNNYKFIAIILFSLSSAKIISKKEEPSTPLSRDNILNNIYDSKPISKEDFLMLKRLAESGNSICQMEIALIYECPLGRYPIKQSYKKAIYWFEKAAQNGSSRASYHLGMLYFFGDDSKRDYKKAKYWFEKTVNKHYFQEKTNYVYIESLFFLAQIHRYGLGTNKSSIAMDYYIKLSKLGQVSALYDIATVLLDGEIIKKDINGAIRFLIQAAKRDYIPAINLLGILHLHNIEVKSPQKAFEYFDKAAKLGSIESCFYLGLMYYTCDIIGKDINKAIFWYEKAAMRDDAPAQFNLGLCLIEQNMFKKGRYWFKKAAQNGIVNAAKNLSEMYLKGIGCKPSIEKASKWLKIASDMERDAISASKDNFTS